MYFLWMQEQDDPWQEQTSFGPGSKRETNFSPENEFSKLNFIFINLLIFVKWLCEEQEEKRTIFFNERASFAISDVFNFFQKLLFFLDAPQALHEIDEAENEKAKLAFAL